MPNATIVGFRTRCPICRSMLRVDRAVRHLTTVHPDFDKARIGAIERFVENCLVLHRRRSVRLELNLNDLSYKVLDEPAVSLCPPVSFTVPTNDDQPNFLKCVHCKKLLLAHNLEHHVRLIHGARSQSAGEASQPGKGPGPKGRKKRKKRKPPVLARYATASLPSSGWPVQGGAPGLGKRA